MTLLEAINTLDKRGQLNMDWLLAQTLTEIQRLPDGGKVIEQTRKRIERDKNV